MKSIKCYLILIPIATLVVVLDQWTKSIIRASLAIGDMWMPWDWLAPYARIVHWYNTGVAFGLFQSRNQIFAMLSMVVSAALIIFYPKITQKDWFLRIAISLLIGGSIGNLIDRLTIGHVTDFISVGNFPIFNIADASITISMGVMLIGLWVEERNEKKAVTERIEE